MRADLALKAGMTQGAHNVGVVQVLSDSHFHGGPIRSALYVLVLLRRYDLQPQPYTILQSDNYWTHLEGALCTCLAQAL